MPRRTRSPRTAKVADPLQMVAAMVDEARSRGAIKALGRRVDDDPALRASVEALATRRGVSVVADWTGKKLVRATRDREGASRVRTNPIRRDQAFVCLHCGHVAEKGGGHVRDHCPRCLRSRHVDVTPGDRAAACGGLYDPTGFERVHGDIVIRYTCRKCGTLWRGRAHADDQIPPDFDVSQLPGPGRGVDGSQTGAVQRRARTLPLRVLETIRRHRLWAPGQHVLVAVSGGLDSTVLLELLVELADAHRGRLSVASVDHGLRPESAGEVARVSRRARSLDVPFHALSVEVAAGPDLAARARDLRWAALTSIGADVIATAHHRDDQAETVLQHLLRGSGARGLRGMQHRDGQRVRPLLDEPRAVLQRWAEDGGLSWVEDPSNPASERGRLRAIFLELEGIRAGAAVGMARSARLLARDDAFLEAQVAAHFARLTIDGGLEVDGWRDLHPALQVRLLLRLVAAVPHGVSVRADQLERLLGHTLADGATFGLAGGWSLQVRTGRLTLQSGADDGTIAG